MNVFLYEATFPRLTISNLLPTGLDSTGPKFPQIFVDRCDPRVEAQFTFADFLRGHLCLLAQLPQLTFADFH